MTHLWEFYKYWNYYLFSSIYFECQRVEVVFSGVTIGEYSSLTEWGIITDSFYLGVKIIDLITEAAYSVEDVLEINLLWGKFLDKLLEWSKTY